MIYTNFMKKLEKTLLEKDLNPNTVKKYIQNLYIVNDKEEFNNINFLKNIDKVKETLDKYKLNTKLNITASIISILKLYKSYKSLLKSYEKILNDFVNESRKVDPNEKTEVQKENWIEWSEVQNKLEELKNFVNENIKTKKDLTTKKYNKLLEFFILSLFTLIPPRRNLDYMKMLIVKNLDKLDQDKNFNYLDLKTNKMFFNNYKTSKKYGQQIIDLNQYPKFKEALDIYLKFFTNKTNEDNQTYLLQNIKGQPLDRVNSITRILNNIFNKKIGASMLRHIYLTNKFSKDLDIRKETAEKMGHSIEQQKDYIKNIN